MKPFEYQGLNLTGWSKTAWSDHALVDAALNYIKSTGANFVPVDWAVHFNDDGTMVPLDFAGSMSPSRADLTYVITKAHQLGLEVFLKPHVTMSKSVENRNHTNTTDFTQFSLDAMFRDWSAYMRDLSAYAERNGVEGMVIGTEMSFADTGSRASWAALIADVRARFTGFVTYDALFSVYRSAPDAVEVVFWDLLDAISVSLYVPLSRDDKANVDQLLAAWTDNPFGDVKDVAKYLSDLAARHGKPLLALEGGYQSIADGLYQVNWDGGAHPKPVDFTLQVNGLTAYLSALEKYAGDWFAGVSLWEVPPEWTKPLAWPDTSFATYGKPAASTVTAFFTGAQSYISTPYIGTGGADTINAGTQADTVHAGSGSDIIAASSGNDIIYQSGLTPTAPTLSSEIKIIGFGGILEGVAPKFSVYVNGTLVGAAQLVAQEDWRVGLQPMTNTQTFTFQIPPGVTVESLKITLDNDDYKGPGLDRNFQPLSVTVGGIVLKEADATYYPKFSAAKPATWFLYESGYVEFGLEPLATTRTDNDTISGGAGHDVAVYAGRSADFAVSYQVDGSWRVADQRAGAPEGIDRLTGIEVLRFTDKDITIGVELPAAIEDSFRYILRAGASSSAGLATGVQVEASLAAGASTAFVLDAIVKAASATSAVATLSYQFFTGKIPGAAGMDYLVSPTGPNANNLNSTYYQSFNLENRYINFAVNLGKLGEGRDAFVAKYGALTLLEATREAYKTIFGATPTDAKLHALIDTRVSYFASYGGDGPDGQGTKAAMVGWLLAEAEKSGLGVLAKSNHAWLLDLADGSAPFAVDILDPSRGYYKPDYIFGG